MKKAQEVAEEQQELEAVIGGVESINRKFEQNGLPVNAFSGSAGSKTTTTTIKTKIPSSDTLKKNNSGQLVSKLNLSGSGAPHTTDMKNSSNCNTIIKLSPKT